MAPPGSTRAGWSTPSPIWTSPAAIARKPAQRYPGRVLHLASQSPQRAELLRRAGIPFAVVATRGDEETVTGTHAQRLALERAQVKGRGAAVADGLVLAADTVVALGSRIIGTPRDEADARELLTALGGTTHTVITGHWLGRFAGGAPASEASALTMARVTMRPFTAAELDAYLATGEWRGRAGAYAIQESGDRFVTDVQGALGTVIGLHVDTVRRLMLEVGA